MSDNTETKTVKKSKRIPKTAETTTVKVAPTTTYSPYDKEAFHYMFVERVPGAFSPFHYVGPKVSEEIAQILGRSINLEEAKHLVKLDGPRVTCALRKIEFQPMAYLPFTPRDLGARIQAGEKLTDIKLPYGGAFYITRNREVLAYSGSVFLFNKRHQRYEWASISSPLVMFAEVAGEKLGRDKEWGHTSEEVNAVLEAMDTKARERKLLENMASTIIRIHRPNLGRMSDAFDRAERSGNGKSDRGYNRAEARREEKVIAGKAEE